MTAVVLAPEIGEALRGGRAVVALETTLVTHGLPRPEGLRQALALEHVVRAGGALPATIGVLDGVARVGLRPDELERLAQDDRVAKLNLSNLASGIASGRPGSTTVAATLLLARRAGIRVLATGGIGGVHRGASESDDVSADLQALARFPVAVVCSGAKALLDLPRTLERLESLGVPVYGLGTARWPAFYRRDSGLPLDHGFDDVPELARAVATHFALAEPSGVVVANPIPAEHELPPESYEGPLERALAEAQATGRRGRELTPFLLERLRELSDDASLRANCALLQDNARVAAALARALAAEPTPP